VLLEPQPLRQLGGGRRTPGALRRLAAALAGMAPVDITNLHLVGLGPNENPRAAEALDLKILLAP